jgi:hypothetical protein
MSKLQLRCKQGSGKAVASEMRPYRNFDVGGALLATP